MLEAVLVNYQCPVRDQESYEGAYALDGIRYGRRRIVKKDYDLVLLRDEMIEEFERDNPGFNAIEGEIIIREIP